ncbi:iron ABC transporter permease [uncultured Pseudokineococcus sp.]|uniref:FecCD family ABC transporter permease n=1 Tax=uncultured Pseudokineococcus sp. TaxID=1642928 RepID=UPI0034313542
MPRRRSRGGDPLGLRARQRRHALVLWGLAVLLLLSALVAAGLGAVAVPPATTAAVVGHQLLGWPVEPTWSVQEQAVVWDVRAPRVLLAAAVGAGLAVCGTALQAMVRNVLADPYVLGVNSGASLGAAAAILLGALAGAGQLALPAAAFAGALGASVLVLVVARGSGVVTSLRLLLAGVGVGYALSAATSFLVFASGSAEGARSVMFWLLGSLALAGWGLPLAVVLVVSALTAAVLLLLGPRLDALAIGDETAQALGVVPAVLRVQLVVLVSLCVGVLVASSGSIGFVGLVVPHLARRLVGAAHRRLVPASALLGAVLLIWSDLAARTVLAPQELPIGIVTALVGAPFLLHLVRRHHATT